MPLAVPGEEKTVVELLRVFNNNIVLAREIDGTQAILTGRGLGLQMKPGTEIDSVKVVKKFTPADGRDPDHMGQLLAQILPGHVHMIVIAMREVGIEEASSPTLVFALVNHLGFVLARTCIGQSIEYPLTGEAVYLYPDEYTRASAFLDALNRIAGAELPKAETTAFTLHLVNAGFASGDLSWTQTVTGAIQQILKVIAQGLGIGLDSESISTGCFITHLRYLPVRICKDGQLVEQMPSVVRSIIESYPRENACAKTTVQLIELRLGTVSTENEIAYLTLHLVRLSMPPMKK